MAKKGTKRRSVLFVLELLVLLVLMGGLFVYGQITSRLSGLNVQELNMDKVETNDLVSSEKSTGYTNIALFGIDSRSTTGNYNNSMSDTIIIASINNDTKSIKLVSIYRDTYLYVGGGDDTYEPNYQKCNSAYAYGGAEQAVSMLNTNFDLNISEYITVDFNALVTVIDLLGGLDIEMSGAEVGHMNSYCIETSKVTGKDYTPIEQPEDNNYIDTYHLNGVQATSYARIRYIGLDFQRTERQRIVLQKMFEKVKGSSLSTLTSIMDQVFPLVRTSLSQEEILTMGASVLSYELGDNTGFPFQIYMLNNKDIGDVVVPTTLDYNVEQLHHFLFSDEAYEPSNTVIDRSEIIKKATGLDFDRDTGCVTDANTGQILQRGNPGE